MIIHSPHSPSHFSPPSFPASHPGIQNVNNDHKRGAVTLRQLPGDNLAKAGTLSPDKFPDRP